jgi:hypothetical protein
MFEKQIKELKEEKLDTEDLVGFLPTEEVTIQQIKLIFREEQSDTHTKFEGSLAAIDRRIGSLRQEFDVSSLRKQIQFKADSVDLDKIEEELSRISDVVYERLDALTSDL